MPEVLSDTYKNLPMAGEYGNQSVRIDTVTLAAAAIGDTVLFGDIPGSARIFRVTVVNAALGALTTLDLGYRYKRASEGVDDLVAFFDALDTVPAGRTESAADVVDIEPGLGAELVGAIAGGAASGKVTVIVEYIYRGQ